MPRRKSQVGTFSDLCLKFPKNSHPASRLQAALMLCIWNIRDVVPLAVYNNPPTAKIGDRG